MKRQDGGLSSDMTPPSSAHRGLGQGVVYLRHQGGRPQVRATLEGEGWPSPHPQR